MFPFDEVIMVIIIVADDMVREGRQDNSSNGIGLVITPNILDSAWEGPEY